MENLERAIEEVFQNNDIVTASFIVDRMVRELVKQGQSREKLITILNSIYNEYETEGREKAADYILGIMDALAGFTHSENLI